MSDDTRRGVVYRMYDEAGTLLYVGQTTDYGKRMTQHKYKTPWWHEVSNVTLEHLDKWELLGAERVAILREYPKYNKAHARLTPVRHVKGTTYATQRMPHG